MAINPQIVSYIKSQLALGVKEEIILNNLEKVGWARDVISESMNSVLLDHAVTEASQPQPGLQAQSNVAVEESEFDSVNSPYSVLLAFVLFISLFILTNGIFSDIRNTTTNVNHMLLYEGLFVIPFLLVAFLLHNSFKEEKNRFKILSFPYFIMGSWILLRLLWKVGENIWKADNAMGVYIVLGMVIIVLTGIIIFVQHFIKK